MPLVKRVLIIGGTGMLRGTTEYFISNNFHVSIIGRDPQKLNYFTSKFPTKKTFNLISIDYTESISFLKVIEENIKNNGSFNIIISWVHSNGLNSFLQLIDVVKKSNDQALLYHIKGSSFYDSAQNNSFNRLIKSNKLIYREIFLGYKRENNLSRWLTNDEISSGVIKAIKSNNAISIIGRIDSGNANDFPANDQ